MEHTIVVSAGASDPAPLQYLAPYAGAARWARSSWTTAATRCRLRRPVQARLGLPPGLAAAAPPARPRGLSRRRLLPALAPAGARRAAERGVRRRLAHRAADHRDAGERRLGLHPDERHLDHRRPDLPARPTSSTPVSAPAVNVGISVSRVGGNAQTQGDEAGRRHAAPRPGRSSASSRPSPSSAPTSTRPPAPARPRPAHARDPEAAAVPAAARREAGEIIFAGTNGHLDDVPVRRSREFEQRLPQATCASDAARSRRAIAQRRDRASRPRPDSDATLTQGALEGEDRGRIDGAAKSVEGPPRSIQARPSSEHAKP